MAVISEEAGTAGWVGDFSLRQVYSDNMKEAIEQYSRPVAGLTLSWPSKWVVLFTKVLST